MRYGKEPETVAHRFCCGKRRDVEGIEEGDATRIEGSIHPYLKARGLLVAEEGAQSLLSLPFTELLKLRKAYRQKGDMLGTAQAEITYTGSCEGGTSWKHAISNATWPI